MIVIVHTSTKTYILHLVVNTKCVCRYLLLSYLIYSGFSYVDLVEDAKTRKLYALKRIVCHGKEDEKVVLFELFSLN